MKLSYRGLALLALHLGGASGFATMALWPRSALDCTSSGREFMTCPAVPSDFMPTCGEPTKHLDYNGQASGGKTSGGCTARCECPYNTHDDFANYLKIDPMDRKAIFDEGTGQCIPYEACPICTIVDSMIDLQALDPPEWCNSKTERKNSQAKCERTYFTLDNGNKYRCKHNPNENKCKAADEKFECAS